MTDAVTLKSGTGKATEVIGNIIFECPDYIVVHRYPAPDVTVPRRIIELIANTRTLKCPNSWHQSAPARARLICPECPEDETPCAYGQCPDPAAHAEGAHDI